MYHIIMSPSFDEHLEAALRDYNEKVNMLESSNGTSEEMLDALINRGSVLSMMEHNISAISDFDDAILLISELDSEGKAVDAGIYVKAYVSKGELICLDDIDEAVECYSKAASRLNDLNERSRYYDGRKLINMCLNCCEDLIDGGHPGEVTPFIDKLTQILGKKDDDWSRNRYVETLNLSGQALNELLFQNQAMEYFDESIDIGLELSENGALEDAMSLIFPLVSRGDIEQQKGMIDQYFVDRKVAISLLEDLLEMNKLDDIQVLVKLHQDVAHTYLTLNKVKEAEEHLLKEVMLNMDGAEEYIKEYAGREMPRK